MTAHGFPEASGRHDHQTLDARLEAAERAAADAERASSDEWAALVRPRHSRKAYARQIAVDVAIALVALLIMVLLS